jgi:kynurenine formamidase
MVVVSRIVDLSALIEPSAPDVPELLRTDIEYADHSAGAAVISAMFGVGSELLRDGEGWANESFTRFGTHNSTHVDAPWHYNSRVEGERAQTIDELPLDWFYGPGVCLDFTGKADGEAVTVSDLVSGLAVAGCSLAGGEIVLIRTGRDQYYGRPEYMGLGPGVTAEATVWLCDRGIRVMGIDAWGWDAPLYMQAAAALESRSTGVFWAAHQVDRAYCQIERLVGLDQLPATGFDVACFPLKLKGGSAAPARVVAIFSS